MTVQMLYDLFLGFREKPQVPSLAACPRQAAQDKRSQEPHRCQPASVFAQFVQTSLAPGQVIVFLVGGLLHGLSYARVTRG
ncbi:MAG: hypothetical protein MAG794_00717 [Gammaproteobacteria bacterium]|nr:hypothetical protein [Gammaproteobacteria bacterium]